MIRYRGHHHFDRISADDIEGVAQPITGQEIYVHSGTGNDSNSGLGKGLAMATLDAAIGRAEADKGDVIWVMPGHSETLTAKVDIDKAGISIIGLGNGDNRPQFTINANIDGIDVGADNVLIANLHFNEATNARTAAINIGAAFCEVAGCHFDLGVNDLESITIEAAGLKVNIHDNTVKITANGPTAFIEIESATVSGLIVEANWIDGGSGSNQFDTGAINSAVAHKLCLIKDNIILYGPAVIFSAAATGVIVGNRFALGTLGSMLDPGSCICIDNWEQDAIDEAGVISPRTMNPAGLADGAIQAATLGPDVITAAKIGDGALSEEHFDVDATGAVVLGKVVVKATGSISGAGDKNLFTVSGGLVAITSLTGEVTVQIGADQDHTLQHGTTDIAALLLCDSDPDTTVYGITGTPSDALVEGAKAGLKGQATVLIVDAGTIKLVIAGNTFAGDITWRLTYVPIEVGASVAPA